jgi:N-acetylglutamate synthase/N-acetylornithine aminotransferase
MLQNVFCAAPVVVAKNHLNNHVRALVINSGNANAGTGVAGSTKGLDNAYQVCEMVAQSLIFNNKFFIANLILPPSNHEYFTVKKYYLRRDL